MKSKSSIKENTVPDEVTAAASAQVYETRVLLKSNALKGYQKDFAKVILTKPVYTIEEAVDLLNTKLKEEA